MNLFPKPDLEPPSQEPSWAPIAVLLALSIVCLILVLVSS